MFPINFNFPYRKKDGSIITMEKALDGAGADLDLIDLDDVAITNPIDDDGLVYDATAQKWENVPIVTQAQNRVTGVHQFLYNRVKSAQVVGGLTITPNADGSFTVGAGTATSDDTIMVSGTGSSSYSQAEQKLPVGNYYASCEGAVEGVYLRLNIEENNQQKTVRGTDVSITVSSAPSNTLAFIQVLSGTVIPVGGITIKPLIRLQSDSDKTITPYAKTNRELTDNSFGVTNRTSITVSDFVSAGGWSAPANGVLYVFAKWSGGNYINIICNSSQLGFIGDAWSGSAPQQMSMFTMLLHKGDNIKLEINGNDAAIQNADFYY